MAKKINVGAVLAIEGEKEYKQAISGVNSTVKTLKSDMKLLSAEFSNNQNSIDALSKKDELLNRQMEEQKNKVELLKKALENAKNMYGENDTRVDQWQQSLNSAQVELIRLDDELNRNRRYLQEAENSTDGCAVSIDNFGREISAASESTDIFGEVLKANLASEVIINGVKELASGVKDMAGSMVDSVKDTAAYADEILTLHNNTGLATDTLQELKYMEELTDVSLELVTKSMQKNIKSMSEAADGSEAYARVYKKLGVNVTDSNGALRDSETVYWECIDALRNVKNETERDALAMEIFGKSAQDLNSIIAIGSEGIAEFAAEAEEVGAVLDDKTLGMLGEADDTFQRFDQTIQIVKKNFGIALAPAIERATDKISQAFSDMDNDLYDIAAGGIQLVTDGFMWIMDNGDTIISVLGGIGTGLAVYKGTQGITALVNGIKGISIAAGEAGGIVTQMGNIIANHPWETAAIAIGVVTTAVIGIMFACQDTQSETAKLREECEELNEAADESVENYKTAKKAREDSISAAETEAGKIQILTDKLYELAAKEKLTNAEKLEMKTLIDQINKLYPDLNLAIDENTGALNKSKKAVDETIDSYKKALMLEAAQDSLAGVAADLFDTQMALAEANEKQAEAYEKLEEAASKAGYSMEQLNSAAHIKYNPRQSQDLKNAVEAYDDATEAVEKLTAQEKECNEEFDKINDIINENTVEITENSKAIDENNTVLFEWKGQTVEVTTEAAAKFSELSEAYRKMKEQAQESIHEQIGLFDAWDVKVEESAKDILANLDSQIKGMENWATNIQTCAERGIDEGLLRELADMGPSAAGYFDVLAKMTDKQIADLNNKYKTKLTWESSVAGELADISTGMSTSLNELKSSGTRQGTTIGASVVEAVKNGANGKKKDIATTFSDIIAGITTQFKDLANNGTKQGTAIGSNIAAGIKSGVDSQKKDVLSTISDFASGIITKFKSVLKINSPSKVFTELGEFTGEGYSIGVKSKFSEVNDYLKDAINTDYSAGASIGQYSMNENNSSNSQESLASVVAGAVLSAIEQVEWKVNFEKEPMATIISDTLTEALQ